MKLIDTHAHLDDEQLKDDLPQVLARFKAAGVQKVIAVGTTAASSRQVCDIARDHANVAAAVGIQPNYVHETADGDWDEIVRLAQLPQVVAIGETGLDHYWDFAPLDQQRELFALHLKLSQDTGLPFIVHLREPKAEKNQFPTDCAEDIMQSIQKAAESGPIRGVMHSYTGNLEYARRFMDLGMYISFAGMITFKKSHELRAVAAEIPADRLLIETDAPYLSPEPKRSCRPNEPALVRHTAECLADARGVSLEELAALTTANACTLFGWDAR